ncbi:MAG: hypothetical protein LUI05_06325 [Oscillospiraceae bacterium]|nr:hypothetical protein [Oscillospiraceae bacterium]
MSKKVSIIIAVISVIMIIASAVLLSDICHKPTICKEVKSVLDGCEQLSSGDIIKSYDSPDQLYFGYCVTVGDYLSECGFNLSFFDESTMKIENLRVLGASEDESGEINDNGTRNAVVYIAVDYTDADNNSFTCAESFKVVSSNDGKIRYVS